ncbi:prepilin peptidase [Dongia soli]|uniref:Prepilin peptidase n=1 Tax=Dongia soli TaxID=600628 RepID=A0ABU5EAC1_9PROT|nr:prepilin peptidase [Dongia soli]MDY0883291.1 prepilin peptidase [Dongia soli]
MVSSATAIAGIVLMILAALSDSRSYLIPNWLTAGVALTAAVSFLRLPFDLTFLALHLGAALLILAVGFALFAQDLFGGGDVKLLTALALWTGFADLPRLLLVTTLAGGLLALGILIWRRLRLASGGVIDQRLPYGIAIAAGGIDFCIRQLEIFPK